MCILKSIFRTGLIASLVVGAVAGGTVLVAGPQRAKAVFHKVHERVVEAIDHEIDDTTALRSQLEESARQYPKKIARVRADLAELMEQTDQLRQEKVVAERVVLLADENLQVLEPKVAQAASHRAEHGLQRAAIAVGERVYSYESAASELQRTRATRTAYAGRAESAAHDLVYLEQQQQRLEELLLKLEGEYAQFQTQMMQLNRQVDAIERNDRLISQLEERQKSLDELSRFESISIDHFNSRLSKVRAEQEAKLDLLAGAEAQLDYEDMARMQLQQEARGEVIEIEELDW